MTTKNIQDVVAELLAEFSTNETVLDDNEDVYIKGTAKDFASALEHHLTQLVKEVEAGERKRVKKALTLLGTETLGNKAGIYKPMLLPEVMKALTPPTSDDALQDNK